MDWLLQTRFVANVLCFIAIGCSALFRLQIADSEEEDSSVGQPCKKKPKAGLRRLVKGKVSSRGRATAHEPGEANAWLCVCLFGIVLVC